MITETAEIERALDEAAALWPELGGDRPALLRRLIARGAHAVEAERAERLARRRDAIRETAGALTGVYPADAAQRLKDEWPA
jgi:hypothetical protein